MTHTLARTYTQHIELICHFRPNNSRTLSLCTDFSREHIHIHTPTHTHTHNQESNIFAHPVKSTLSVWKGSINSQLPSAFRDCTHKNAPQPWSIKTHMNTLAPGSHSHTRNPINQVCLRAVWFTGAVVNSIDAVAHSFHCSTRIKAPIKDPSLHCTRFSWTLTSVIPTLGLMYANMAASLVHNSKSPCFYSMTPRMTQHLTYTTLCFMLKGPLQILVVSSLFDQ